MTLEQKLAKFYSIASAYLKSVNEKYELTDIEIENLFKGGRPNENNIFEYELDATISNKLDKMVLDEIEKIWHNI